MSFQLSVVNITHEKIFVEIKEELRKNKKDFTRAQRDLEAKIESLQEKVNTRSEKVEDCINKLEEKIDFTPQKDSETNRKIDILKRKIETIEKAELKNNIVITGIKADPKNVKGILDEFLTAEFDVAGKVIDQWTIPIGNTNMYAIKLDSWETKANILKKKKQLKEREIYINAELTYKERQIGKQLRDLPRQYREEGNR